MQKFTSICFAIGFGLIGFPIVFLTTFPLNMNVFGFWIGMIVAEMFTNTVLFILLYRVKWSVCSEEAINRFAKDLTEPNAQVLSKTNNDDECQELLSDSEPSVQINRSTNSIDFDHLQANSTPILCSIPISIEIENNQTSNGRSSDYGMLELHLYSHHIRSMYSNLIY